MWHSTFLTTWLVILAAVILTGYNIQVEAEATRSSLLSRQTRQAGTCLLRSCDQNIRGSGYSYTRALAVLQNEEYLSEADLDVIRRRLKRQALEVALSNSTYTFNGDEFARFSLATLLVFLIAGMNFITGDSNDVQPVVPLVLNNGVPQPGEPGGGQLPIGTSPVVLEALSLLPQEPGITPVAVFPPWLRPRTFPATAILFTEPCPQRNNYVAQRRISRTDNWLRNLWTLIQYNAGLKRSSNQVSNYGQSSEPEMCYGFVVRVRLVQDQSCTLDVTCTIDGDKIESGRQRYRQVTERQTGEGFLTSAPPDCRTRPDPNNSCN